MLINKGRSSVNIKAIAMGVLLGTLAVGYVNASELQSADKSMKATAYKPINDYNITINYELGMHCTGFDFTYCCVLPPYNSIQSQVVKNATGPRKFPELLDRKSTRLNSSHANISYAVFCL